MKRIVLSVLLMTVVVGACAAALEDGFRDVPVASRPWCYWWWINGHVDKETITSDLEAMRRVGFGGLLMFDARGYWDDKEHLVLPKPKIEFMSPEWRELVKFGVQEAARVGLQVSVNLSSCAGALKGPWPVGAGAPKRLICQTTPLKGGSRVDAVLKAILQLGTVAALAQVRLNGRDLGIVWTAPWQAELTGAMKPGKSELEKPVGEPLGRRCGAAARAAYHEEQYGVREGQADAQRVPGLCV